MLSISTEQRLNDESMLTLFAEVQRIVNNRPLVPLRDDIDSPTALRPNHLLLMREAD